MSKCIVSTCDKLNGSDICCKICDKLQECVDSQYKGLCSTLYKECDYMKG